MTAYVVPDPVTGRYEDAAYRLSDQVGLHLVGQGQSACGRWVAARLSDGGTDEILYDSRADAVRCQLHEMQCAYIVITPDGLPPKAAAFMLALSRDLYARGLRLSDPEAYRATMAGLQRAKWS